MKIPKNQKAGASIAAASPADLLIFHWQKSSKRGFAGVLACMLACLLAGAAAPAATVFINPQWPIGASLSPPQVEPTNACSTNVYVNGFVPKATITVFLNGTTIIGGPITPQFGFAVVPLTQELHTGNSITAIQSVNGVTSQPSSPMVATSMAATLPAPTVGSNLYACGQIVPVNNLLAGVSVEVRDATTGSVIGNGATPNLWGSNWAPVVTSPLVSGHQIIARQIDCHGTGNISPESAPVTVPADPSPLIAPGFDPPLVGNDAITAHGLYTGAVVKVTQSALSASTRAAGVDSWIALSAPITASPGVSVEQDLCAAGPPSTAQTPQSSIPAPVLAGPICPGQVQAIVRNSTINATLVLLRNNVVAGYGGAGPGDVPLKLASSGGFTGNDTVQVAQYIGSTSVMSNIVTVGCGSTGPSTSVTTYHNDSERTGWNPAETALSPASVTSTTFGLIVTVPLDDQVDAQPLVVADLAIAGGTHTVVYVATEGNSVYAIDAISGSVLESVNLGPSVPKPLNCNNNGANVGINSTPTIDADAKTMYVVAYTLTGGVPTYYLHALDLGTLTDKTGSPVTIAGSHTLTNGLTYKFNATVQRQRPALLEAGGNVYVAFGSFCDFKPDQSRGWILGWNASTLGPLAANELTDTQANTPTPFFLSSIWMSGYGIAADPSGNLFFVTGNSDWKENTYTGTTNIQESVVKLPADLSKVADLFTPSNAFTLDQNDKDLGAGGVMVVPNQPGPVPHLAVAAGKDGRLFILNRDPGSMGGFHNPDIPKNVAVGASWCGPSYYQGSDGVGRVVASGGYHINVFTINTAQSPALSFAASAHVAISGQDGGFFTSISSNATQPNTAIVWAVDRPTGTNNQLTLYAFNASPSGTALPTLWTGAAGTWPNITGNANIVPTVANGQVYVASYRQLSIFGLKPSGNALVKLVARTSAAPAAATSLVANSSGSTYWGTIKAVEGSRITIGLRTGQLLQVDLGEAIKAGTTINPMVGLAVEVNGSPNAGGVLAASTMWRAKGPELWGADSP